MTQQFQGIGGLIAGTVAVGVTDAAGVHGPAKAVVIGAAFIAGMFVWHVSPLPNNNIPSEDESREVQR